MASGRFVSYLRVSTDKQGSSGLGLDAQRTAVMAYLNGGRWRLLKEFVEVESGKKNDRPVLAAALDHCARTGATLVIARLDRLSRNAAFLLSLRDSGVAFVAADAPDANTLTIGVMAVVAQADRERISSNTRAALAAAKARGVQLGNPRGFGGNVPGPEAGAAGRIARADAFAARVGPMIRELRDAGDTLSTIADTLTEMEVATARGGAWTPTAVRNVLLRLEA